MQMQNYKVIQKIYNLHSEFDDLIDDKELLFLTLPEEIIKHSVSYFQSEVARLIYPSKSYAVAIIYSYLLEKYFNEKFFLSLNDPDLFCGNDRYFHTYNQNQHVYDRILKEIGFFDNFKLNLELPQIRKTVDYFHIEFSLNSQS